MGALKSISGSRLIVSLDEAKTHLRITHSDDDAYITALIGTAAEMIENFTNRLWREATVIEIFKKSEISANILTTAKNPIIEVNSITHSDGTTNATVPTADYQVEMYVVPGSIVFDPVPSISNNLIYPIEINYTAGIKDADTIPAPVKSAALLIIGHLYENRQDVVVGRTANEMPKSSEYLLYPYQKQQI